MAPKTDNDDPPHIDSIATVCQGLLDGRFPVEEAVRRLLSQMPAGTFATADARVDVDRARRCGFPEVVYAEGKSVDALIGIWDVLAAKSGRALATRVSTDQAAALERRFPAAVYNATARTVRLVNAPAEPAGRVVVVTAGTSDRPIAEEAIETLRWMECGFELIVDLGVAGPQRLLEQRHRFDGADAVVVIAGMEGALPSVVGGWVPCPVIAVPTSVGYGANFGGIAALLGMLNSCASNVCVVNIDSGFKGAYVAGMVARRVHERRVTS